MLHRQHDIGAESPEHGTLLADAGRPGEKGMYFTTARGIG
jgi:hypothetical protein